MKTNKVKPKKKVIEPHYERIGITIVISTIPFFIWTEMMLLISLSILLGMYLMHKKQVILYLIWKVYCKNGTNRNHR